MFHRLSLFLLLTSFCSVTLRATDDPFIGEWKLNGAKSTVTDVMKVTTAGPNKYAFDFGGGTPETIAVDGTDQPGLGDTTLAVTPLAPDAWKVIRKKNGQTIITANWKLSEDGSTLTDNFNGTEADGSAVHFLYVYKRTEGKDGFAGTWVSTSAQVDAVFPLQIRPYEEGGLTFIDPEQTKNVKFDGQEHPSQGPNAKAGSVYSGRRVDNRTLEVTNKISGKTTSTQQFELSPDLKTLTLTVHQSGKDQPTILVFDRK